MNLSRNDSSLEVVDVDAAGPSNACRKPKSRRHRQPVPVPRRKAPFVPPQDIIEISDSDEELGEPVAARKREDNAVETWIAGVQSAASARKKTPLFLPDNDPGE